jgi:putative oxidoreductase
MERYLGRYSPYAYAFLRIVTGLLFAMHGSQKLFGWPPSDQPGGGGGLPPLILAAGVIELVCGLLIAGGFLTRIAAFLASGEMAVAYFKAHAPESFWPGQNHGEAAAVFCFIFLFLSAHGAGIWSVDGTGAPRYMRFLDRWEHLIYAITRLFTGLMFAVHGADKLFGWPSGREPMTQPLIVAAGWIELVCGLLIAIGLFAGWAAFLASGTMAVAYFKGHASGGFWPVVNHGELAVLYCFLWLYVATRGARREGVGAVVPEPVPVPAE